MDVPMALIVYGGVALMAIGLVAQTWMRARARTARAEVYRDMARRYGLTFEVTGSPRGRFQPVQFADPARGLTLTVKVTRDAKHNPMGSTALRLPRPAFPGGLAVYAPQFHRDIGRAAATFTGMFDNALSRRVLGRMLGDDLGGRLGELQDAPPPADLPVTVLASADPHLRFDCRAIAQAIEAGPRSHKGEARTLLILGDGGMDLRVTHALTDPQALESFLALGLDLAETLDGRGGPRRGAGLGQAAE